MKMAIRTDLAAESAQRIENASGRLSEGVSKDEYRSGNLKISRISVTTEDAARKLSKPVGEYVTVYAEKGLESCPDDFGERVEAVAKEQNLQLATVRTEDGRRWFAAFTSFEEEMKGGGAVKSTFLADIRQLFEVAREADVAGVILNPWNRRLALDQTLLAVVLGI